MIRRYCEDEVRNMLLSHTHGQSWIVWLLCKSHKDGVIWIWICMRAEGPIICACACLQTRVYLGMTTLKELILKRPSRQFQYLHVLLDLSSHEKEPVRSQAPFLTLKWSQSYTRMSVFKYHHLNVKGTLLLPINSLVSRACFRNSIFFFFFFFPICAFRLNTI